MPVPDTIAAAGQAPVPNPYGPRIRFSQNLFPPPGSIYMGPSDFLLAEVACPTVGCTLSMLWAVLKYDGTVEYNTLSKVFGASASLQVAQATPSEGFLVSLLVSTNNTSRGQAFTKVFINNPGGTFAYLGQCYTSQISQFLFPGPTFEDSLSGAGFTRLVNTPDVTGGNPSWIVPNFCYWKIRSIRSQFTASAAGSARSIDAQVQPSGGSIGLQVGAAATIAPSGSQVLNFAPGLNNNSAGLFQSIGFPREFLVPPASVISLVATVLDVGDKFQGNNIYVEEFVGT